MNRILTTSFFALLGVVSVIAQSGTLIVTMTDGAQEKYQLSDKPLITIESDKLAIVYNCIKVNYDIAKVSDFKYIDIASIESPEAENVLGFTYNNDMISFPTNQFARQITICNTEGIVVDSMKLDANEERCVNISNWNQGVYAVTINGVTTKVIKR